MVELINIFVNNEDAFWALTLFMVIVLLAFFEAFSYMFNDKKD